MRFFSSLCLQYRMHTIAEAAEYPRALKMRLCTSVSPNLFHRSMNAVRPPGSAFVFSLFCRLSFWAISKWLRCSCECCSTGEPEEYAAMSRHIFVTSSWNYFVFFFRGNNSIKSYRRFRPKVNSFAYQISLAFNVFWPWMTEYNWHRAIWVQTQAARVTIFCSNFNENRVYKTHRAKERKRQKYRGRERESEAIRGQIDIDSLR